MAVNFISIPAHQEEDGHQAIIDPVFDTVNKLQVSKKTGPAFSE